MYKLFKLHLIILILLIATVYSNDYCKKVIKSASEPDYPPFCIVDSLGNAGGFAIEILTATLKHMNKEVDFKVEPWHLIQNELKESQLDVLPLVARTLERDKIFDFTAPYMTLHGSIIIRNSEDRIKNVLDLKTKKIAVMKNDIAHEYILKHEISESIELFDTFKDALVSLSEGRNDAVIIQQLLAFQLIYDNNLYNLRSVGPPIEELYIDFCFAVPEGNHKLLSILNEGLLAIKTKGIYSRIYSKWFNKIIHDRKIIIGGDAFCAPFEYLDENGVPQGYNVDITKAIAKATNMNLELVLGPWSEIRQKLENNEIDAIQGMFYSEERDRIVNFTHPHTIINHSVYRNKKYPKLKSIEDLNRKSIAVVNRDIIHDWIMEKKISDDLIKAVSIEGVLSALNAGDAEYAIINEKSAEFEIKKHKFKNVTNCNLIVHRSDYCYSTTHGEELLLQYLQLGLNIIKNNGVLDSIHTKWFGKESSETIVVWKRIVYVLLVILFIIFSILFVLRSFSKKLKKEVESKTYDLKKSEEKYRRLYKEKEILLKELYHRTKNNMQVIQSLLTMKALSTNNHKVNEMFKEIESKISAMSLVHQKLYQNNSLSHLDLVEYIEDLIIYIKKSYNYELSNIKIKTNLQSVNVTIDTAIPCGLIINELVINAVKYAFKDSEDGIIDILLKNESGELCLSISDSGCGIPENVDPRNTKTLGLQSVITLVEHQLDGLFIYENRGGSSFKICFKETNEINRL